MRKKMWEEEEVRGLGEEDHEEEEVGRRRDGRMRKNMKKER